MKYRTTWLPLLILGVAGLFLGWAYAAQSDGQVMFDDELQISLVHSYQSVSDTFDVDCFGLFRPVKNLIFYLWVTYWPENLQVWRLSAIALFLGIIPMVYRFFGLFFPKQPWINSLATMAWAGAPAMTSVVSWISSTNIIVSGYGFLLYFLAYERAQSTSSESPPLRVYTWHFLAVISLAVACLSYEAAMTAPFLLFLKDILTDPKRLGKESNRILYGLSILTLAGYIILRQSYGGASTIDFALSIPSDS